MAGKLFVLVGVVVDSGQIDLLRKSRNKIRDACRKKDFKHKDVRKCKIAAMYFQQCVQSSAVKSICVVAMHSDGLWLSPFHRAAGLVAGLGLDHEASIDHFQGQLPLMDHAKRGEHKAQMPIAIEHFIDAIMHFDSEGEPVQLLWDSRSDGRKRDEYLGRVLDAVRVMKNGERGPRFELNNLGHGPSQFHALKFVADIVAGDMRVLLGNHDSVGDLLQGNLSAYANSKSFGIEVAERLSGKIFIAGKASLSKLTGERLSEALLWRYKRKLLDSCLFYVDRNGLLRRIKLLEGSACEIEYDTPQGTNFGTLR